MGEPMQSCYSDAQKLLHRMPIIADLNVDPPECDADDCPLVAAQIPLDHSARSSNEEINLIKISQVTKETDIIEEDLDQQCQGVSTSREEKVSSLKAGLIHCARKMPKNAHAHFLLGLMYQRLGQPQKAILAFEKSSEILSRDEEEIRSPELLSSVLIHHAQCLLQVNTTDSSAKELELGELGDIIVKLKKSLQLDTKQAAMWNTLGLILMRTGRVQTAISIFSNLLLVLPDYLDSLANLGVSYLQSGSLELSAKCFQDLMLKDKNHPAALMNYAAFLLCKYGSVIAGTGANASVEVCVPQVEAATVARDCLLVALKLDPRAGTIWINLSNAYSVLGDHTSASRCLEQVAQLEPNFMSARYAIAVHRIKESERSQDITEQLTWAASELVSILKEGDPAIIDPPIVWAGLAMSRRTQHEISSSYEIGQKQVMEAEEHALYALKQAIEEDPDDNVQWHQLGLHYLCTTHFKKSLKFFKAAVARCKECSYAWSNLGISLQLCDDATAEDVYKRALQLATAEQAHAILSNLGNLYRQLGKLNHAKAIFSKSLELCPGYAPAYNNLGLVFAAEGCWELAISYFDKALISDCLLEAAKSNLIKAAIMSRVHRVSKESIMKS